MKTHKNELEFHNHPVNYLSLVFYQYYFYLNNKNIDNYITINILN